MEIEATCNAKDFIGTKPAKISGLILWCFFSDLMSLNLYNNITNTYVDITGNYPPVSSNMAIAGKSLPQMEV